MTAPLADLAALLQRRPYGLIACAAPTSDEVQLALWSVLGARCDTLYWVGPLADKPEVKGGARCWLAECALEDRAASLREVSRRDAHGIHVIGPLARERDELLVEIALRLALSGSVCVLELEAGDTETARAALHTLGVELRQLDAAWLGMVLSDGGSARFAPAPQLRHFEAAR